MNTPTASSRTLSGLALGAIAWLLAGCIHHEVEFQSEEWHYALGGPHIGPAIVVVIDRATMEAVVPIHSFATGIANSWDVKPGEMLKQVADVEFPQVFTEYRLAGSAENPPAAAHGALVLELAIRHYAFEDFQAKLTLHARASAVDGRLLFEKDYTTTGQTQGSKMFWGGAFAMKSAVRQSSLMAFRAAFADLRSDLAQAEPASPTAPPAPTPPRS